MAQLYSSPRVFSFFGEESGCSLWRCFQPFAELQRRGHFVHFKSKDDPECLAPEWPYLMATRFDAVVLPRMSWGDLAAGQRYIDAMHKAGLTVIYEMDDDAFSPGIVQRQYATHDVERAKGLVRLEQDRLDRIACLRQCDGVTVSTERMRTITSQYTDAPIEVVPNAIDVKWFRRQVHGVKRLVPPLTVGWAGGARYPEDLAPVAEAWGRLAVRYPEVTFVVVGHVSPVLAEAVPADRLKVLPWTPIEQYPQAMANIDIGCAAVAPKLFNTAKTPIKLWEYTLAGAVSVVSPTLYGAVTRDGVDGLVAETAGEWESALARLIEDPALRRTLWREQRRRVGGLASQRVREDECGGWDSGLIGGTRPFVDHSLTTNAWRWPQAWQRLIDEYRARPRLALAG